VISFMVKKLTYCVVCGKSEKQQGALLPEKGGAICYPCYVDNATPVGQQCIACGWELYCWPVDHPGMKRAYNTVYCPNCKAHYLACRECGMPTKVVVYFYSHVALCVACSKKYDYKTFKDKYGCMFGSISQDLYIKPGANEYSWISDGTTD